MTIGWAEQRDARALSSLGSKGEGDGRGRIAGAAPGADRRGSRAHSERRPHRSTGGVDGAARLT
jgi:hypothetical protein